MLDVFLQAPPQVMGPLKQLIFQCRYQPAPGVLATGSLDLPPPERECLARIILTAEQDVPALKGINIIKVGGTASYRTISSIHSALDTTFGSRYHAFGRGACPCAVASLQSAVVFSMSMAGFHCRIAANLIHVLLS